MPYWLLLLIIVLLRRLRKNWGIGREVYLCSVEERIVVLVAFLSHHSGPYSSYIGENFRKVTVNKQPTVFVLFNASFASRLPQLFSMNYEVFSIESLVALSYEVGLSPGSGTLYHTTKKMAVAAFLLFLDCLSKTFYLY